MPSESNSIYSKTFNTTARDRANRIPTRELNSSPSSSQNPISPTMTLEQFTAMQEQLERFQANETRLQAENEQLRAAQAPQPLTSYYNPSISVIPSSIRLPNIREGARYNVPNGFLVGLPKFRGMLNENALEHIRIFLMHCSTQNEDEVGIDAYRLRVFPLTLLDSANTWLQNQTPNSINTWEELSKKFFDKYFPLSKRTEIEAKIRNFSQKDDADFFEAWEEFNSILAEDPNHCIPRGELCKIFLNGLTYANKQTLEGAHGYEFMSKTADDAWNSIETLAQKLRTMGMGRKRNPVDNSASEVMSFLATTVHGLSSKMDALQLANETLSKGIASASSGPYQEAPRTTEDVFYGQDYY